MHRGETRQLSGKPFSEAHVSDLSELAVVSNKMAWSSAAFAVESVQVMWPNFVRNSSRIGIST